MNGEEAQMRDDLARVLSGIAADVWAVLDEEVGDRAMWREVADRALRWSAAQPTTTEAS